MRSTQRTEGFGSGTLGASGGSNAVVFGDTATSPSTTLHCSWRVVAMRVLRTCEVTLHGEFLCNHPSTNLMSCCGRWLVPRVHKDRREILVVHLDGRGQRDLLGIREAQLDRLEHPERPEPLDPPAPRGLLGLRVILGPRALQEPLG